jgi:hypothetical protein
VAHGGRPFGAVVCDGDGRIMAEAGAVPPTDPCDWAAHSGLQALRAVSAVLHREAQGRATIFASGEPCPMCAAAIYWGNIRRLVSEITRGGTHFAFDTTGVPVIAHQALRALRTRRAAALVAPSKSGISAPHRDLETCTLSIQSLALLIACQSFSEVNGGSR